MRALCILGVLCLPSLVGAAEDGTSYRAGGSGVEAIAEGAVIATVPVEGRVTDLVRIGDTLYVGREGAGLDIVDVSTPRAPVAVGVFLPGRPIVHLAGSAGRLVLTFARSSTPASTITCRRCPCAWAWRSRRSSCCATATARAR